MVLKRESQEGKIKKAGMVDYVAIIAILLGIFIAIVGNWIGAVIFAIGIFLELWSMVRK